MAQKVLIVEDNALNLRLFTDLLRAHKFVVEPLSDGRDVMMKAAAFAPDLIIMDIQLPEISGLDLIEALRRDGRFAATPILAVTAYAGTGDEERIISAGATGYVSKPISMQPFMEKVRNTLAGAK